MLQSKETIAMMIKPIVLQMAEEYPQGIESKIQGVPYVFDKF